MVDWGTGRYEATAAELEPAACTVVDQARISAGEDVVDLACGTGNATLKAATRGARVVGVDAAARLLGVAQDRAHALGATLDLRHGDLLDLPVEDGAADVVLSVFGLIFAPEPARALREVRRILRPGGRVLFSAWIPEGPIDAMLGAQQRIVRRITEAPPRPRFAWYDPATVGPLAAEAGLRLRGTTSTRLAIRGSSAEAYVAAGMEHPMAIAARPAIERAGVEAEVRAAMTAVLHEANEDPDGFLIHSPYVVHELGTD